MDTNLQTTSSDAVCGRSGIQRLRSQGRSLCARLSCTVSDALAISALFAVVITSHISASLQSLMERIESSILSFDELDITDADLVTHRED